MFITTPSLRRASSALATLVLVIGCAANAHASPSVRTALDGDDFLWMSLAGAGAGATAGVLGAAIGSNFDETCTPSMTTCPTPAWTAAGAWTGLVIGSAAAVHWYGGRQGYRGRWTPTLVGSILGNVASGLPIVLVGRGLDEEIALPLVLGLLVSGPAIGATLGYQYSLPDAAHVAQAPRSGGLIDLSAGVDVGVPAFGFGPTRARGRTGWSTQVQFLGAAF